MTKVQQCSGIDISKNSFNVTVELSGKFKTKKFDYTMEGLKSFLSFLPQATHCIIESTGTYHCRLAYFLYENNVALSVVNPLSVKRYAQALMLRTKTDKADSKMLIEYGKHFDLKQWKPAQACYIELQQLINVENMFIKQRAALVNQLEAINHNVVQNSFAKKKLEAELEKVTQDIKEIEKEAESLALKHEKDNYERLKAIPGIGKKTAIVLLAVTKGMKEFESAKQVSSYFGLCPRIYESGTSIKGKAKICKMGMSQIRKLLYMCALSAKKKQIKRVANFMIDY